MVDAERRTYALYALSWPAQNYTVGMLMPQVTILACFALLLLPVLSDPQMGVRPPERRKPSPVLT